ncbi:MAG: hypothetical protein M3458_11200 [Acidobacteriota bacterium]|nr:hypothetical protein [Acidobacteriota bacterium]
MKQDNQFGTTTSDDDGLIDDPERTIVTPRFDREAVRHARPATPFASLAAMRQKRFWPAGIIALCVAAGIAGGILAGLALLSYKNSRAERSPVVDASSAGDASQDGSNPADREIVGTTVTPQSSATTTPAASGSTPPVTDEDVSAARRTPSPPGGDARGQLATGGETPTKEAAPATSNKSQAALRGAFDEWIKATNSRNINRQMKLYNQRVGTFYRSRNASRDAVRAEKTRTFGRADKVDIIAGTPEVKLSPDGRTATMVFRKKYAIKEGQRERRGEVLQELRWQNTDGAWRIISERDLRVIN